MKIRLPDGHLALQRRTRWRLTAALCLFAALLGFGAIAPSARGQDAPAGPLHPKPGVPPEPMPPAEQLKYAIRVRVNQVTTPVIVRDSSGEMVFDLKEPDFKVFDNGTQQKIDHFDVGGDPLSIVLVMEASSHIAPIFPTMKRAGIIFAETVMAQTSEAAVLSYDSTVDLRAKFTTDTDAVRETIETLPIGVDDSLLYDAMARGISMLNERPAVRRRVMLVVGEAQDSGSEARLGEVLRQAQLSNVTIYSIGLSTAMADLRAKPDHVNDAPDLLALAEWLVRTGKNAITGNSLEIASKATGGLHTNPVRDRSIEKGMDAIGGELHAQYTISYRPSGEDPEGYHEIKVEVDRQNVTVRARPGYYIAPVE
ncbi:MAG TPA: VWA domain-containing protein [Candidatus Acidoferrales bacterium]